MHQNQTIVLPKAVRLFKRSTGDHRPTPLLCRAGLILGKGVGVTVGKPQMMCYDHRDQLVVPLINGDQWEIDCDLFIIVEEMGNLNKQTA